MNKKIIIWALFDDSNSSYTKSIYKYFNNLFDVHCIGINSEPVFFKNKKLKNYHYHKIDLSLTNLNLDIELKKLPPPQIVLASPPCECWSGADCSGRIIKEIKKDKWCIKNFDFYDKYNKKCNPVKRRYFLQKETSRIVGENTIGATIKIIKSFKPKFWIIENPTTSKIWDYQKYHWNFCGHMNKTYYSSYDKNFSTKPTIFKSNIKLILKSKKFMGNKNHMAKGNYITRSSIPLNLIRNIIDQILKQF